MSLAPKLPNTSLPTIAGLPGIPLIGCIGGDATSYFGNQFGGLPGLQSVAIIRAMKKALEEQIYALLKGKLNDILRPAVYDARMVQLTSEVAQILSYGNEIITTLKTEIDGAISYVNDQVGALNGLIADINAIEPEARTLVQQKLLERYSRYFGELEAQIARFESAKGCLGSL